MLGKRLNSLLALVLLLVLLASASALAGPCRVVASVPAPQAAQVDPGLTYIEVRFDQDMLTDRWSWVTDPKLGAFPVVTGKPKFVDARTCRLPVQLKPGTAYAVGINTGGYGNFQAQAAPGVSCAGYQIVFTTGGK
ncbi:Ig-like domain-containing protein [Desulfoferula mesophila]|uniref:SbsA Ig-like domain-containing protein n=1 Tax=Desulfoferula mesophila TaxID=3058419 RepID=A0AAU9EH27_9BACT|nr:hypothetical protein FAK_03220 [Desulfoferula mesophilus]